MKGEGILLFQLYYINQWLFLAFQMLGVRVLLVIATAGIHGLEEKKDTGRMTQNLYDRKGQEGIFAPSGGRGTC